VLLLTRGPATVTDAAVTGTLSAEERGLKKGKGKKNKGDETAAADTSATSTSGMCRMH
jgi:hypothetical protein